MKRMAEKESEQAELMQKIQEKQGGSGRVPQPQKMSKNLLRGSPHKETGLQLPQL
jgi:hypothetical protein